MSNLDHKQDGGAPSQRFHLDKHNAKLAGVCAGIANYFNIDVTMVRILFVAGTVLGFGSLLLVYLLIALVAD